jgi:hypothetical protein
LTKYQIFSNLRKEIEPKLSQEACMLEEEQSALKTLFGQYIGWQIRIFNPNDEGTYYQGPIESFVTRADSGLIAFGFMLTWTAIAIGQDTHWKTYRDEHNQPVQGLLIKSSVEDLEDLAEKWERIFADQDALVYFVPPGDKIWIEKPTS